ncbi:MAG: septum formation protein Maf [Anaerolineae bacterium]|nr:septum formation protein Maf [Anaerolineae bacterium]
MTPFPVILASASPRRREFLQRLGIPFQVLAADIEERNGRDEMPDALVARLSLEKALAVAARHPHAVVIGADTIVTLDQELLGKPADRDEAASMLRRLRDCAHVVYSGVTVCPPDGGEPLTSVVGSTVWMRAYTDDEIDAYVASGDPMDKAGAYAIQNAHFHPVARMEGCYASVMGLPLCELGELLRRSSVALPLDVPAACSALTGVPCCCGV